jgi:UDP-N-acetylglucosamine 1-carboxyvinyltransferase
MPDRIETGSFAVAAAITQGDLVLRNTEPHLLQTVLEKLTEIGAIIKTGSDYIHIYMSARPKSFDITTKPFPAFPTDLQAQFMALATIAQDSSLFHETIFENRYMHACELVRMGANIEVHGSYAKVHGVETLYGAQVMATDLRASMSLILAGLRAEGITTIDRIYHLDRGYENIEQKLNAIGAKIRRSQ